MWRCFNKTAGHAPFSARPCQVDLNEKNMLRCKWSHLSESFNFAQQDRCPDALFNQVIGESGERFGQSLFGAAACIVFRVEEEEEDQPIPNKEKSLAFAKVFDYYLLRGSITASLQTFQTFARLLFEHRSLSMK